MKKTLIAFAVFAALTVGLQAQTRTWTSADGKQTFEGALRSYDAGRGNVTVLMANGKALTFPQDKLSEADITFLTEWEANKNKAAAPAEPTSKLGKMMAKAKLHKIEGKRFKKVELTKDPEFYVLYYSASW